MSQLQKIMREVEAEFEMAGLSDGLYGDLATETAERYAEKLTSDNAVLRAEVTKWKNESVIDANTVYSLSCQLAQRTGEVRELAGIVDDLIALTRRLVHHLAKAAPESLVPDQSLDYLKRKGLQGSPMRDLVEGRLS